MRSAGQQPKGSLFRSQPGHAAAQGVNSSLHLLVAGTFLVALPLLLLYILVQKQLIGGIARIGLGSATHEVDQVRWMPFLLRAGVLC
jgi:hypothetical protein